VTMNMALCISHPLTPEQCAHAHDALSVQRFIPMPETLRMLWANVPPTDEIPMEILSVVIAFLKSETVTGDLALIQGEFGLAFAVVDWCGKNGRVPVYCTTKRVYDCETQDDGAVLNRHTFRHVRFRRYFNAEGKAV
jgi:hypothetical protein